MIAKDKLSRIVQALRRMWTANDGAVAIISGRDGSELYRICCGRASNPYLMASRCRIWKGAEQVYEGDMTVQAMLASVSKGGACKATVTTVRAMRKNSRGLELCCGKQCRTCEKCELKC